jgi:tRNA 2-thiouridine synthesizing protein A
MTTAPDQELDARGLRCPEPVMLLHKAFSGLTDGQTLRVVATDPTTERDIPQFCRFLGHELLRQEIIEDEYVYVLRKGA